MMPYRNKMKKILLCFLCITLLAGCAPAQEIPPTSTVTPLPAPTATVTNTPMPEALWISPTVPANLIAQTQTWNIPVTTDPALATQKLDVSASGSSWIYALVAPFPTVLDGINSADLISTWKGAPAGPLAGHSLIMAESTLGAFTALWGEPASGLVRSVPAGELVETAWSEASTWAIIPFEEIQSKWKVLTLDGQSPMRKDFDPNPYVLKVTFGFSAASSFVLPESNRDPAKLTTVILTGVTALVRATAATMELKGVPYPGSLIRDWMREADIAHISNEVPFDKDCPYPNSSYRNLILCSDPKYLDLLLDVGTDVVELTGDHFADRGVNAMLETLDIYKANNLPYYGGGADEIEARKPLLMEINGTKLAFMGCNGKIKYPHATATIPGAANCDYDFFVDQVKQIKAQGYLVIFTFQHQECYSPGPCWTHEEGFRAVADAGADVVSGSQAHYPHIFEFRGDALIHYGLGNLFFDQMTYTLPSGEVIDETRREFLDRHVFYDGHYLGVELLTAMLDDYSIPRPMTEAERAAFLSDYFYYSGFSALQPTPAPIPTVTLTPMILPSAPITPTP